MFWDMQEGALVREAVCGEEGVSLKEGSRKVCRGSVLHTSKDSFLRRGGYLERLCRICFRCRGAEPWVRTKPVPDYMK
jgi:hypothetical protein